MHKDNDIITLLRSIQFIASAAGTGIIYTAYNLLILWFEQIIAAPAQSEMVYCKMAYDKWLHTKYKGSNFFISGSFEIFVVSLGISL